jgi:predicted outer membrane repeat protein
MATFTVANTNDSGAGSLRDAIDQANASVGNADTIEFAAGLSGQTIRLASTLGVNDQLTINGDIDGDGKADITITGDVNGDDTTIAGTSITNIVGTAATELDDNVRILSSSADLTLDGLVLTGGVFAAGQGGAIRALASTVTLTNSTVSGNSAGLGGGIIADNVTLTSSTVSGNSAGDDGGGIYAITTANLTNSTVSDNRASGNGGNGGGINATTLNLTNSTLSDNTAGANGGGAFASFFTLTDSTVSGNSAGNTGGGLVGSSATLTNVTVSGNSSDGNGGGISATLATLTNSTVSGNSAGGDGGGILAFFATLTNSIVLGNDAATSDELDAVQTRSLVGGNIIGTDVFQDNTDIGNTTLHSVFAAVGYNPNTDVVSGVLADNGGLVETIALKENAANPALDASNSSAPATDALGNARFDNAGIANTNGSAADLGAYEVQNPNPTVTINQSSGQNDPVINDGPIVFDVVFSKAVTGFDENDISFAGSTVGGTLAASISGGGASYTVSVTGMTGSGTVVASILADAAIAGGFSSEASTSTDNTVTFDGNAPVVSGPVALTPIAEDSGARLITQAQLLANASDADGPPLTATGLAITAGGGTLVNNHNGTWSFTPGHDDAASVAFAYSVTDGIAAPVAASATLDITPVNDAPVLGPLPGSVAVAENTTAVTTATATDVDGPALTFSLSGADAARFVINPHTGVFAFAAAPNFEAPADAGHNNVYDIVVKVSDGTLIDSQALAVSVTDVHGNTIVGSKHGDTVDDTHTAPGQPLPTGEEDFISGGKGEDRLFGLGGNDLIDGGKGKSVLIGGEGNDSFLFDTGLGLGKDAGHGVFSYARIVDFTVGEDSIALSHSVFKALDAGPLADADFRLGGKAKDADDHILYKAKTGALYYDHDGKGGDDAIHFATLAKHLDLDAGSFLVT